MSLRGLLPRQLILDVRAGLLHKAAEGGWLAPGLHRLRIAPPVIALFDRIFGERTLPHPMFVQRNIFPRGTEFDFTAGIPAPPA